MRGVLIQPPLADPSMASLGLAYLSNALSKAWIEHMVVDANLEYWKSQILTSEIYPWPETNTVSAEKLYEGVGKNLFASLKNMEMCFPGYSFSLDGCGFPGGWHDLGNIRKLSQDPANPFFRWSMRESDVLQRIQLFKPDWIGISVTFEGQLLSALSISYILKQMDHNITIILGGALFTTFQDYIDENTPFWDVIDGIVIGPGEEALTGLAYIGRSWMPSENVRATGAGGWVANYLKKAPVHEGCPDFAHFPLNEYWASGAVLPYRVLPRCSWNKCAFCADARYAGAIKETSSYAKERIQSAFAIAGRYNAEGIYFMDAEITPETMGFLAESVESHRIAWGGNARFTPFLASRENTDALYRKGCRLLRLGLESGSPTVLSSMSKGITLDMASKVLRAVSESGIVTHVYLMKGFPLETSDEWQDTANFVRYHAPWIDMISISKFTLYVGSSIWQKLIDRDLVESKASSGFWIYPEMRGMNKVVLNAKEVDEMLNMVLIGRGGTRSCLTSAHTLMLSHRFSVGLYSHTRTEGNRGNQTDSD